jgi:hypothetical protein
MKNGKNYFTIFILTTFLLSCKKDERESIPFVPPVSTMSVDFSFISSKKSGWVDLTNWQYSTISLAVWDNILNNHCAVPINSFEKAIEQKASALNSNEWEWVNKFNTDTLSIRSRLVGKVVNDSVEWKLYISTIRLNVSSPDYLWIEGKSASNQSGGWWLIYDKPSSSAPLVRINWSNQNGETVNKFVLVKPGNADYGQYLEYRTKSNSLYNALYTIKIHNENFIFIELIKENKEGRIKSQFIYNDMNWHCWNSSLDNVVCN